MVRPLFVVMCSALTLAAGCTQPVEEGAASEASASCGTSTSPGPRYVPTDLSGARYNVFVGTAPCASIPGVGGTWRATPTFSNDRSFCEYWWAEKAPFDLSALRTGLESAGIDADAAVEDVDCENLMEVVGSAAQCRRPVVSAYFAEPGGGGGGQYTCRSCVRASDSDSGTYVDVVIPASLVTSTASVLNGVFGGIRFGFWQPGGVSTFRVVVPRKQVTASASAGAASCAAPSIVTPSSIVAAGGGGCGTQ